MTNQELMDLEFNDVINYGPFKKLKFKGKDERHVTMEDVCGDTKKVYIELFLKHAFK